MNTTSSSFRTDDQLAAIHDVPGDWLVTGKAKGCATPPVSDWRLIEVLTTPRLVRWWSHCVGYRPTVAAPSHHPIPGQKDYVATVELVAR
jgi:hypothetical protein